MMFRIILTGLALALAPILALYAHASSAPPNSDWGARLNGFLLAEQALGATRASEEDGQATIQADEDAIDKARLAYSKEPFASEALFILALDAEKERYAVLRAARNLDKRSRLTGLALLEGEVAQNNVGGLLSLIDELSRVSPELAPQFVAVLAESLGDAASLPLLEQALREEPSWAGSFWRRVPQEEEALSQYIALRQKLSPPHDAQTTRNLLGALVKAGRFEDAFQLFEEVQSGSTQAAELYPPMDWRTAQTRDVRARQTSSHGIDVFIQRNSSGELARKLVQVTPGEYRLSGEIGVSRGSGELRADLSCAAGNAGTEWRAQDIASTPSWNVGASSCRYAWLVLEGSAWDSSLDFEATIEDLTLERL